MMQISTVPLAQQDTADYEMDFPGKTAFWRQDLPIEFVREFIMLNFFH